MPSVPYREVDVQENVPAEQQPAEKEARVSCSHEHGEGTPGPQETACQGPEEIDRLGSTRAQRFTRDDRLLLSRQFDAVYSRGARVPGRHFTLFILPNSAGHSRLGVTLSRKVGKAVVRNQARRRLRELFRRAQWVRGCGLDIIVHAKPEIARRPQAELESEFLQGISRYLRGLREHK